MGWRHGVRAGSRAHLREHWLLNRRVDLADNQSATGTAAQSISVSKAVAKMVRVGDLALSVITSGRNKTVKACVVSGAVSGKTGLDGTVSFTKATTNSSTATFTVTGVTPPAG